MGVLEVFWIWQEEGRLVTGRRKPPLSNSHHQPSNHTHFATQYSRLSYTLLLILMTTMEDSCLKTMNISISWWQGCMWRGNLLADRWAKLPSCVYLYLYLYIYSYMYLNLYLYRHHRGGLLTDGWAELPSCVYLYLYL